MVHTKEETKISGKLFLSTWRYLIHTFFSRLTKIFRACERKVQKSRWEKNDKGMREIANIVILLPYSFIDRITHKLTHSIAYRTFRYLQYEFFSREYTFYGHISLADSSAREITFVIAILDSNGNIKQQDKKIGNTPDI